MEVIASNTDSAEEVAAVQMHAVQTLQRLEPVLGASRVPRSLRIRLLGTAEPGQVPDVDPETGDVRLFKYDGTGGGYTASLSHEIVHACRHHLWTDETLQTSAFLYLEEGLAEMTAIEIGFPSSGFPLYETPVSVAAGQWLVRNEALPLDALIRHHIPLNFQCTAQAYTTRLSFVTYLHERSGLEPMIDLAYRETPLTVADIEAAYDAPLSELAQAWEVWAREAYHSVPDAQIQADRFRNETPIRYFPVCGPEAAIGITEPTP